MYNIKSIVWPVIILLFAFRVNAQPVVSKADSVLAKIWVDSVMQSLSPVEKVGQLLMVRANDPGKPYNKKIKKYIKDYNIGGVVFFRGNPHEQASITNEWQSLARTPLFVAIDGEWGLGMRLNGIDNFPFQMTLGAVHDDSLIYMMGQAVGRQCKRMGVQINFAPVVDINSNPANPVIGMRSFGSNKYEVARKSSMYMKGMQEEEIISVAKHFPGHGDTDSDSHHTLPTIKHDRNRLDSVELYPFKYIFREGAHAVMTAHLNIPSLEKNETIAATLSPAIIDSLLKEKLAFNGLIITDALDMKGVSGYHKPGEIEVMALKAGNDILLLPQEIPSAVKEIMHAVKVGEISAEIIEEKCKKILFYKYFSGLHQPCMINPENLTNDLNNSKLQIRQLFADAITLLENHDDLIPLKRLDTLKIASLSIGAYGITPFQDMLRNYTHIHELQIGSAPEQKDVNAILESLNGHNLVIIDIQQTNIYPFKNYGIHEKAWQLIKEISNDHKIILDIFASPYSIMAMPDSISPESLILSYQDNPVAQELSAQIIFGGIAAKGEIPVDIDSTYHQGSGINTQKTRLEYGIPEQLGITYLELSSIDSIIQEGLDEKAYPGCQVFAAKNGVVFYNKGWGHHTYHKIQQVSSDDIYDIASLTKIAATTPAIMKLSDEEKLDVDRRLYEYLPFLKGTDKERLITTEILAHQAGLKSWIPYYQYTLKENDQPDTSFFSRKINDYHNVRVAENLYVSPDFSYVIIDSIRYSGLTDHKEYHYSDLGFYLLVRAVENISNVSFEAFAGRYFYQPLGLQTMGFHPRKHFSLSRIIPTEDDKIFRKQLLYGDVHDQGAALLGGVSGHAGLFSNARDMGVMMQMFLNYGKYGGERYIDSCTIVRFTSVQFPLEENRRGLGFDKPMLQFEPDGPNCRSASPSSFGHSGFTGTYTWADPENELVYVFLSNRIHPDATNNKISELNIRTRVHQAFYDLFNQQKNIEIDEQEN